MIDNFDKIEPLLEFDKKGENFYFLQILQRKKDHKQGKVNGTNNNSRLIKAYYVYSKEYFEFIKPEVIELCKLFNARAGINLNRRNFEKMALQHLKKITDQIINGDYNKAQKAYSSVVGAFSQETDKKWILDVDIKMSQLDEDHLLYTIDNLQPIGKKLIAKIPSKSGFHYVVKPFNKKEANHVLKQYEIELHCNNPTNLFIP